MLADSWLNPARRWTIQIWPWSEHAGFSDTVVGALGLPRGRLDRVEQDVNATLFGGAALAAACLGAQGKVT